MITRDATASKNIEVVFQISSSWVKIRLHTKNQLPMLSKNALIVMIPGVVVVVWWWWCGFLTDYKTTPTKVVLSCFGLLVGLCQFKHHDRITNQCGFRNNFKLQAD